MATTPKSTNKSRSGNPAKAAADKKVLSFTDRAAQQALEPMMPGFRSWMDAAGVDAEQSDWLAKLLLNFFKNYAMSIADVEATTLDAPLTSKLLESAADFHPEMRLGMALAVNSYLKFLSSTDAWTGSKNDLTQLLKMTGPEYAAAHGLKLAQYVAHPPLTPQEAGAARAELVFVRRAAALLAWIGEGRELTDAKLLRRKDIAAAAACVDTNAVGSASSRDPRLIGGDDSPIPVSTMTQLPRLMHYWQALIDARLIVVSAHRVKLTDIGHQFHQDPAGAEHDTAVLAYFLFYDSIIPYGTFDPEESVHVMVALALADAASNTPMESELLFGLGALAGPRVVQTMVVASQITQAAEEGLVEIGTHITVPPALRRPLATALKLLDDMIAELEDEKRVQSRVANRKPSEATYQLKIQIDGITPPVWRRVLVPAEIGLDELHDVIQRLFACEDRHLHEFRLGDFDTGIRYAPEDSEAEHWGEPPLDEWGVPLNTLLAAQEDILHYQYDFGDNWEHTITLEKVWPAAGPNVLPLCDEGRGHAPQEDSFGPHGWMEKLEISADPNHPEHKEIRTWLGLRKGRSIDPQACDLKVIHKRLEALRTFV